MSEHEWIGDMADEASYPEEYATGLFCVCGKRAQLEAENEQMRKALQWIADHCDEFRAAMASELAEETLAALSRPGQQGGSDNA